MLEISIGVTIVVGYILMGVFTFGLKVYFLYKNAYNKSYGILSKDLDPEAKEKFYKSKLEDEFQHIKVDFVFFFIIWPFGLLFLTVDIIVKFTQGKLNLFERLQTTFEKMGPEKHKKDNPEYYV